MILQSYSVKLPPLPIYQFFETAAYDILSLGRNSLVEKMQNSNDGSTYILRKSQGEEQYEKLLHFQNTSIYQFFVNRITELGHKMKAGIQNTWIISNRVLNQNIFEQNTFSKNILALRQIDYAKQINNTMFASGYFGSDSIYLHTLDQIERQWRRSFVSFEGKYFNGFSQFNDHNFLLTHDSAPESYECAQSISCIDLNSQASQYTYKKSRECLTTSPLRISSKCFLIGHINNQEWHEDLMIHDTRCKNIVAVLDSGRQIFGGASWGPKFHKIFRNNQWSVGTIWGSPGGRNNHVVRLDFRYPMHKQMCIKNIGHLQYVYKSKQQKCSYWIVRKQYQSYKLTGSKLQKIMVDES